MYQRWRKEKNLVGCYPREESGRLFREMERWRKEKNLVARVFREKNLEGCYPRDGEVEEGEESGRVGLPREVRGGGRRRIW